jgi:hypothetical protein
LTQFLLISLSTSNYTFKLYDAIPERNTRETAYHIRQFKPILDLTEKINIQYCQLGYCWYLSKVFDVELDFIHLPFHDYIINLHLFGQIMSQLCEWGVKIVIFDEVQRQLWLIEFITKENADWLLFIITGTPPHGQNTTDYGGSVSSRVAQVSLSDLRPPEVRQFLQATASNIQYLSVPNLHSQLLDHLWWWSLSLPALCQSHFGSTWW